MTCHDDYALIEDTQHEAETRYVVGVDGSPAAAAALRWAVHQARATGGRVQAVYAFEGPTLLPAAHAAYLPSAPAASLGQRLEAEQAVAEYVREALTGELLGEELVTARIAVGGDPRHVLVERSRDADVLVLGASHRTAFATRVLGSTASTCAAVADCPVMVVPAAWVPRAARLATAGG